MTADVDCVPLDLSLNSKYKLENYMSEEDESSEYNSDHNAESEDAGAEGKSKDLKSTKAYKKNLMKRYYRKCAHICWQSAIKFNL